MNDFNNMETNDMGPTDYRSGNTDTDTYIDKYQIKSIIQAVLFAAGDHVKGEKLAEVLGIPLEELTVEMDRMTEEYSREPSSGLMIRKINDSYQLCTKPELKGYIDDFLIMGQRAVISQAAYEVLAIIAYGQPVTRSKIEKVRGVNSDGSVVKLLDRGLIKEVGRLEAPGHPTLYGTTDEFLRCFGFSSLEDLPALMPEEVENPELVLESILADDAETEEHAEN